MVGYHEIYVAIVVKSLDTAGAPKPRKSFETGVGQIELGMYEAVGGCNEGNLE